jgi:hypothetical protein
MNCFTSRGRLEVKAIPMRLCVRDISKHTGHPRLFIMDRFTPWGRHEVSLEEKELTSQSLAKTAQDDTAVVEII